MGNGTQTCDQPTHQGVEAPSVLAEMRIDGMGDCGVECHCPYHGQFLLIDLGIGKTYDRVREFADMVCYFRHTRDRIFGDLFHFLPTAAILLICDNHQTLKPTFYDHKVERKTDST
jgi:hypothetical protein